MLSGGLDWIGLINVGVCWIQTAGSGGLRELCGQHFVAMTNSAAFRGAGAHPEILRVVFRSRGADTIPILTLRLAGSAHGVHLVAWVTLALKVSFEIDADLTAGVWVLTLVYVCEEKQ